ncbi:hypothetical protein EJ06DRAFT_556227 [Trichodelitschia bisporula]|uniref:Uncharacterized protein n=1 Tax=Trichodelitschia bisporula TaxID=703511 RepID=A0A6G1HXG4_9PEZI|nr:hypothetical protein EJ06DRAFT_556227 [Trichodelitschia bisporula]
MDHFPPTEDVEIGPAVPPPRPSPEFPSRTSGVLVRRHCDNCKALLPIDPFGYYDKESKIAPPLVVSCPECNGIPPHIRLKHKQATLAESGKNVDPAAKIEELKRANRGVPLKMSVMVSYQPKELCEKEFDSIKCPFSLERALELKEDDGKLTQEMLDQVARGFAKNKMPASEDEMSLDGEEEDEDFDVDNVLDLAVG